jgi:hypothetical protein
LSSWIGGVGETDLGGFLGLFGKSLSGKVSLNKESTKKLRLSLGSGMVSVVYNLYFSIFEKFAHSHHRTSPPNIPQSSVFAKTSIVFAETHNVENRIKENII